MTPGAARWLKAPAGILGIARRIATAPLLSIMVIGTALRLLPVLASDFPLNDGGMFSAMSEDLRANSFVLPRFASYNDLQIPYAYPPLGFYLTAGISSLAGISVTDILRLVPALVSVATIPLSYAISREIFRDHRMALATAAFFAFAPRSYEWLIGGGGITRGPAFLVALVAVLIALRMHRATGGVRPYLAGAALGVSALWHPEAGMFGAVSVVVTAPFMTLNRWAAFKRVAVVAGTSIVVVLPWLIAIVAMHGLEPFVAARATGGSPLDGLLVLAASRTTGGYLEIMGIATSVGLVVCAIRRSWLIPAWMTAIVLSDPRAGATYASVPAAMAAAFLVRDVGRVVLRAESGDPRTIRRARVATGIAFAALAFVVAADSLASRSNPLSPVHPLSADERLGMEWVAANTHPRASFLVVSGSPWFVDAEAEWFPVLADRHSVSTVQGHEWLGDDTFDSQYDRADLLLRCVAASNPVCLELWLGDAGQVDYLFLTRSPALASLGRECCHQVVSLVSSAKVVYRNEDVVIARLLD